MESGYICIECGHNITPAAYELLDNVFCPECSGRIEQLNTVVKDIKDLSGNSQENLLITCESCNHRFSRRANKCPKCEWVPTDICGICKSKILSDSKFCPECGDPSPFLNQESSFDTTINNKEVANLSSLDLFGGYTISEKVICPHCNNRGCVAIRRRKAKKGLSGAKATGALLTAGLSIFATGLSRKEWVTDAICKNCDSKWQY